MIQGWGSDSISFSFLPFAEAKTFCSFSIGALKPLISTVEQAGHPWGRWHPMIHWKEWWNVHLQSYCVLECHESWETFIPEIAVICWTFGRTWHLVQVPATWADPSHRGRSQSPGAVKPGRSSQGVNRVTSRSPQGHLKVTCGPDFFRAEILGCLSNLGPLSGDVHYYAQSETQCFNVGASTWYLFLNCF